jgi:Cu2+-exporting ATPase
VPHLCTLLVPVLTTMPAAPVIRKAKQPGDAPASGAMACAHCGDSLSGLKVISRAIGGRQQDFCCLGCAFIAEQLHLARASDADRVALEASLAQGPARREVPPGARVQVEVRGMVCAACALLIEHRLRRTDGVAGVHVDFTTQRAYVGFDPQRTDAAAIKRAIERAGYRTDAGSRSEARAQRIDLLRVLIAWLMMMQVMMLAVPAYVAKAGDIPADIEQLLRLAQLVLTVPVMLFSAVPIVRGAWSQLRAGPIGMDLPIMLGLAAAFAASAWATITTHGPVYFDSITMFVALVLGVRWLQARALRVARGHLDDAQRRSRLTARRLRGFPASLATESVAAEQLVVDDHVLVPVGETVPADGLIVQGASSVSQAWLTGEATPIEKQDGAPVLAGSVNLEQPLVVRVTRAGEATSLAALRRLVDDAGRERPRIVELANRIAVAFLWIVLAVTAATVVGWWWIDPAQALPAAVAVLVATCPCALSLAAPAALAATQSALAERGVLTARSAALEAMARIDVLACDKTGTLTTAEPALTRVIPLRGLRSAEVLAKAAALEAVAAHPFARALAQAAARITVPVAQDVVITPSAGIEGTVLARRLRIGKIEYALGLAGEAGQSAWARRWPALAAQLPRDDSVIALADEQGAMAVFAFGEMLRADAATLVEAAHAAGVEVVLVSGDRAGAVERVARALGIERVYAQQTPASKRELVAQLQGAGRRVAMLGDGFNDAPVLAQADVSIALAEGAALAQARADFIVLGSRAADVAALLRGARRGMSIVRENFVWALVYNLAAIPLAAFGYLSPALAAVGMAASSAVVVANALRARR